MPTFVRFFTFICSFLLLAIFVFVFSLWKSILTVTKLYEKTWTTIWNYIIFFFPVTNTYFIWKTSIPQRIHHTSPLQGSTVIVRFDGVRLSANCGPYNGLIDHITEDISEWRAKEDSYWQGQTEELGEKSVSVLLCPQHIPHWLIWTRTRTSAVRGRPLTAWVTVRPKINWLMLFKEITAVYPKNHTKPINTKYSVTD